METKRDSILKYINHEVLSSEWSTKNKCLSCLDDLHILCHEEIEFSLCQSQTASTMYTHRAF